MVSLNPKQEVTTMTQLRLYTPSEVADLLSVSTWTIYRWIREGKLHCYKLGGNKLGRSRITHEDVDNFLKGYFSERS